MTWTESTLLINLSRLFLYNSNIIVAVLMGTDVDEADAYVGPRISVSEGTGVAAGDAAHSHAEATLLLLCTRVPQQYRAPKVETIERF